jgi:hypothetical protein
MREEMHELFRRAVRASGTLSVELRGDREQRFARATRAIDVLLAGVSSTS